jgi:predicted nucleic acid-binding protein
LHQVRLLDILPASSSGVMIPVAVARELATGRSQGRDAPDVATLAWLSVRIPAATPVLPDAMLRGTGESEVLWLALEAPASVAVLDEMPARNVARQIKVSFTGTLGLLVDAKSRGIIPAVAPVILELDRHRFRMSRRVREMILMAAVESP